MKEWYSEIFNDPEVDAKSMLRAEGYSEKLIAFLRECFKEEEG